MPLLNTAAYCADDAIVEQTIEDFKLVGYDEKGKPVWDMKGERASVVDESVNIEGVKVKKNTEEGLVELTSKEGLFNRETGVVELHKDVVATSSDGTVILTDKAGWDTKSNIITTEMPVNIINDTGKINGIGGNIDIENKKAKIDKDVKAELSRAGVGENLAKQVFTEITCTGPLVVDYAARTAVFENNVVVKDPEVSIKADKLCAYFDEKEKRIYKVVAEGNVVIEKGGNITRSKKAEYDVKSKRLVVTGEPQVVFYDTEMLGDAEFGSKKFD